MFSYAPFNYEQINVMEGIYRPSQYKGKNNQAYLYWSRSLYQRMESLFKFDLPWNGDAKNFFTFCLFRYGHVGCFNSDAFGFTFQPGFPSGQGWFYQPTHYQISNPALKDSLNLKIGDEVEVIKLTSDYYTTFDIISRYASILAELDTSLKMAIQNSRFSWLLGAKNKGIAETLKKIYDKISTGESLIIYDKAIFNDKQDSSDPSPFQYLERKDVKNSYMVDMILRDIQNVIMEFDCEVGLPTLPYQKKERMVSSEADSKVKDGQARYNSWYENLSNTIMVVNDHFRSNLKVTKTYNEETEVINNESV